MSFDDTLATAVESGVLTAEQARRVRAISSKSVKDGAEAEDDEALRFISGFGDVFVTIGIVLFAGAMAYFLGGPGGTIGVAAGLAAIAWGLAEFFTRVRRMALPSIVLLLIFACASYYAGLYTISTALGVTGSVLVPPILGGEDAVQRYASANVGAGLFTTLLVYLHYLRFKVPITVAAGAAALACAFISLVSAFVPQLAFSNSRMNPMVLIAGIAIFALAMRFDFSDPERVTRRTDIAFWLHLLAAPMIVHPLVSGMFSGINTLDATTAVGILALFLVLGFVAVLIDRRAILVSGLSYAGIAFAYLLRGTGITSAATPTTMLVLGVFVLLLSAGWRPLRRSILAILPTALTRRLPQPHVTNNT